MSGADALMTTFWSSSSLVRLAVSMKAGTCVVNFVSTVLGLPSGGVYVAFFFSVPSIVCSVEEISCTLPARTCSRKNGW